MKKTIAFFLFISFSAKAQTQDENYYINLFTKSLNIYWDAKFKEIGKRFIYPKIKSYTDNEQYNLPYTTISGRNFYYVAGYNTIFFNTDLYFDYLKRYKNRDVILETLAHEYGHAVEYQLGKTSNLTLTKEFRADCISGVYFSSLDLSETNKRNLSNFFTEIGDSRNNVELTSEDLHPNKYGRLDAFNLGYTGKSVNACISKYKMTYQDASDPETYIKKLFNGLD